MKKNKILIFILISSIFIIAMFGIYGYRFIHYYLLENKSSAEGEGLSIYEKLINNKSVTNEGDGLFKIDENYIYKGSVTNNYVYFSGRLWRIVSINENKEIKMITENSESLLVWGYESNYENSYIRQWLNSSNEKNKEGTFLESLGQNGNGLLKTTSCIDNLDSLENITCEVTNKEDYISLLSSYEYKEAEGASSYLNNEETWWLINTTGDLTPWFVTNTGGLNSDINIGNNYYSYGIRPVIMISGENDVTGGIGTKDDPYTLRTITTAESLSTTYPGEYLNYSNLTWRIISSDNEKVKIVLDDYIKIDDEYITKPFSNGTNDFNTKEKFNIAYYLNNNFYDTLENKDYIIQSDWYTGNYNIDNEFDYNNVFKTKVSENIGLLRIGEPFNNFEDTFLLTSSNTIDETLYGIDENKELTFVLPTENKKIRPALCLDINLNVSSGEGTKENPYEISR